MARPSLIVRAETRAARLSGSSDFGSVELMAAAAVASKSARQPLFFPQTAPIRVGMRIFDGFGQRISLAMAGKKSPWGGGSGNDGGGGDEPIGAQGGDKPKGPRNPWLPQGGRDGERRSASIEDIFKNRGPEGPRRRPGGPGGPGGPNFRMPERPGGKSWVPVIVAVVVLIWIGVKSSGKIRNTLDYTVSGRDVAWIVVLATTAATMVGGGASIGSVANVYNYGIALALLSTAWYLQLIFTGIWLAPRLRRLDLLTVAQFFGLRFGEAPRRMAVVSCMIFLIGALVAQMVAMK